MNRRGHCKILKTTVGLYFLSLPYSTHTTLLHNPNVLTKIYGMLSSTTRVGTHNKRKSKMFVCVFLLYLIITYTTYQGAILKFTREPPIRAPQTTLKSQILLSQRFLLAFFLSVAVCLACGPNNSFPPIDCNSFVHIDISESTQKVEKKTQPQHYIFRPKVDLFYQQFLLVVTSRQLLVEL